MIPLLPENDLKRHQALLRLVALVAFLAYMLWHLQSQPPASTMQASVEQTPARKPVALKVRANSTAEPPGANMATVSNPPTSLDQPVTEQAGQMEEGIELPVLDLDMDASTLNWLAKRGKIMLLARNKRQVWKILPGATGYNQPVLRKYLPADARALSTRAIPLHRENPWHIDLGVIQTRLQSLQVSGSLVFEIRLSSALDQQIAKRQMSKKAASNNAQDSASRIVVSIKNNKVQIM